MTKPDPDPALERGAPRAEMLLKITAAIADAVSRDEVYRALVEDVAEAFDASGAALWLVDDDDRTATLARARGFTDAAREAFAELSLDAVPSMPVIDAIRRGEPVWIPSQEAMLERYPHLRPVAAPGRSYRAACLPLLAQRRVLGLLALTIEEVGEAGAAERELLLLVAKYAGQALERLRLLDEERRLRARADAAAARLEVLSNVSRSLVAAEVDVESLLGAVAAQLGKALDGSVTIEIDGEPRPSAGDEIRVPLRARGHLIGTLTATREGGFADEDQRLCQEIADRAAIAVENGRLHHETALARARAEQLYRFAQAVVAASRPDAVFDAAIAAIEAALAAQRSAILILDEAGVMRFRAWRNLSDGYRAAVEGHSPWPAGAFAPEPVLVPVASLHPLAPIFQREGIGALAFIPLLNRGRLLGKLMVYYDRPRRLAAHELETARAIANHLASVIVRFAAVAKLEETIRVNELFAGILAHDLRNPLAAMMTAAHVLLVRHADEDGGVDRDAKPLGRILSSGERMATMIDQLLDFTRARIGGGIVVEPREADLGAVCAQAVEELELTHGDWRIEREVAGDPSGCWDPERLLQAISNVVANAGVHGSAAIVVRVDGTRADRVAVEVHNEGAIPESLLPHVFDPFLSTRQREPSRGLGLGLFIVREIVHAHGGTVAVSSSPTDGTTFRIELPRRSARRSSPLP